MTQWTSGMFDVEISYRKFGEVHTRGLSACTCRTAHADHVLAVWLYPDDLLFSSWWQDEKNKARPDSPTFTRRGGPEVTATARKCFSFLVPTSVELGLGTGRFLIVLPRTCHPVCLLFPWLLPVTLKLSEAFLVLISWSVAQLNLYPAWGDSKGLQPSLALGALHQLHSQPVPGLPGPVRDTPRPYHSISSLWN